MRPDASDLWKIDFNADEDGSLPLRVWLESVPEDVRGKVLARINLLTAAVGEADKKIGPTRMVRHEAKLAAGNPSELAAGSPARRKNVDEDRMG